MNQETAAVKSPNPIKAWIGESGLSQLFTAMTSP